MQKMYSIGHPKSTLTIFNFNFVNYKERLDKVRPLFTKRGYAAFNKSLEESHNLDVIIHKQYILTSSLRDKAKIINEGVKESFFHKDYVWEVVVPVRLTYQGKDHQIAQDVNIILEIKSVDISHNKVGLAIDNLTIRSPTEGMPVLDVTPN